MPLDVSSSLMSSVLFVVYESECVGGLVQKCPSGGDVRCVADDEVRCCSH